MTALADIGIHRFGAYVPAMHISRAEIVTANRWANGGLAGWGRGEPAWSSSRVL